MFYQSSRPLIINPQQALEMLRSAFFRFAKRDERILGDSDFVQQVLENADEQDPH